MTIAGAASAFPKHYYKQQQIAAALKRQWAGKIENPQVLDRRLSRVGVDGRFLSLPIDNYEKLQSWGEANDAWIEVAEELGEQALCRALTRAGLGTSDLNAIFFT